MAARKGCIEKEVLEDLVGRRLSTRDIGEKLDRGQTSIRYWLKVYGLETNPEYHEKVQNVPKKCSKCGEANPSLFYGNKRSLCSTCHNKYTSEVGWIKRAEAIKYLGGKCIACDYNEFSSALDVHHTDPTIKDSNFRGMRGWSWERIEKEIQSCVLLCKNCHAAYHSKELEMEFDNWV